MMCLPQCSPRITIVLKPASFLYDPFPTLHRNKSEVVTVEPWGYLMSQLEETSEVTAPKSVTYTDEEIQAQRA